MKKLFDLRFVIGAFFAIIGLLLVAYALVIKADGKHINLICGGVFVLFGFIMMAFSSGSKDENSD
jgi:hypothetical protein